MNRLSTDTKETILYIWRGVVIALLLAAGSMIWNASERSGKTADKVATIETAIDGMRTTLDAVKASASKTDAAINLSVLRILEEHTRQIGELQRRDTQMTDDVATLRIAAARMEVELANLRKLAEPSSGRPR